MLSGYTIPGTGSDLPQSGYSVPVDQSSYSLYNASELTLSHSESEPSDEEEEEELPNIDESIVESGKFILPKHLTRYRFESQLFFQV